MIATGGSGHQVALAKTKLPDEVRRNPRVTGICQVTVSRTPYESTIAGGIEPADRFAVGHHRGGRCLRLIELTTAAAGCPATTATMASMSSSVVSIAAVVTLMMLAAAFMSLVAIELRLLLRRRCRHVAALTRRRCTRRCRRWWSRAFARGFRPTVGTR
jgi:hypothetical protein